MKTAVEWLEGMFNNSEIPNSSMLFKQAKEMDKEQKMDFANWCRIHENLNKNKVFTIQQLFDKYYKETFKP